MTDRVLALLLVVIWVVTAIAFILLIRDITGV